MNDATILRLAELLAEYEGREGPGRPTGKARWLLERLDGVGAPSAAPPSEPRELALERHVRQQDALNRAVTCPNDGTVAMFKCPKCGDEFYDHTQSLASSGEHNGLRRALLGARPPESEPK